MTIEELEEQLVTLEKKALAALRAVDSFAELEAVRLSYLGQKGSLTEILRKVSHLNNEDKPKIGQLANSTKDQILSTISSCKERLYRQELERRLAREKIDVTLPGTGRLLGHIHPLTKISAEIIQIFYGMGFSVAEGPELETDYYLFSALNYPEGHPARDEQDTFYTNVNKHVLLRSQTSTVQVRTMERQKPPLKIISPGRVYRNEEVNARKYPLFHQVEGLLVDRNVTFGQLKGTLNEFIRLIFGKPLQTRFRPDFFPFTEPSAELDCQCPFCQGQGCRTCGQRGWLELLGCGMVDPNVLEGVGIDSQKWSGFAFGMGVERLAMLKYGINDVRYFFSGDLRFLEQFNG